MWSLPNLRGTTAAGIRRVRQTGMRNFGRCGALAILRGRPGRPVHRQPAVFGCQPNAGPSLVAMSVRIWT